MLRRALYVFLFMLLLMLIAGWITSSLGCLTFNLGTSRHNWQALLYHGKIRFAHKSIARSIAPSAEKRLWTQGMSGDFMNDEKENAGNILWEFPVRGGTGWSDAKVVFHIPWALRIYQGRIFDMYEPTGIHYESPILCAQIPILLISLPLAFLFIYRCASWLHYRHNLNADLCRTCSYDLRMHAPGSRCPECGTPIPTSQRSPSQLVPIRVICGYFPSSSWTSRKHFLKIP